MRRPNRPADRPAVVDLNARRRVVELQKQARKAARPAKRRPPSGPIAAWAILLAIAVVWALIRWLQR
ncbi:MAG: hypothetical protein KY446_09215 [Proteobacteria bacterium]|nr:hypothetical protein [Pseudomonadota bacterium]MBW3617916.1 hypothetical protein [Pseudomonadota bacterium]